MDTGGRPALGPRPGRRALPGRAARRLDVDRLDRPARPRIPRETESPRRPHARPLGVRSPVLDRRRRAQHARPASDAAHRGGAAPRRRAREDRLRRSRAAADARERVDLRGVRGLEHAGVGVLRPAHGGGRLRDAPRRQQRLRQRVQPRLRPEALPRRDRPVARDAVPPRRPHEQGHAHHRHAQRPRDRRGLGALSPRGRAHGQRRDAARVGRATSRRSRWSTPRP